MTDVVLDASLAAAYVLSNEASALAERVMRAAFTGELRLLMPPNGLLETGNAILGATRRGRLDAATSARAIAVVSALPIELADRHAPLTDLFTMASVEGLSIYDAAYLALAFQRNATLASADGILVDAARRHGILWQL